MQGEGTLTDSLTRHGHHRPLLGQLDTNLATGSGLEPRRGRRGLSNDSTVYDKSRPRSDSPAHLESEPEADDPFIQTILSGQTLTPASVQSAQRGRIHDYVPLTDGSSRRTHGRIPSESEGAQLGRQRSTSEPPKPETKDRRRGRGLLRLWKKRTVR